jgi:hypothetical protein
MIKPRASNITKEFIFSKITQQQVFEKYLQISIADLLDGKLFCNPLRDDDNPTCSFAVYINNVSYPREGVMINFRDWADSKGYDCIGLVQKIANNCTYFDALCLIAHHFNLLSAEENKDFKYVLPIETIKKLAKTSSEIELLVKKRNFTIQDIKYWKQYYLDLEDLEDDVFSIKTYWLNGNKFYPPKDLGFVYIFNKDKKVYCPLADKKKSELRFIHNNATVLQGETKLKYNKSTIILTSSYKDVKLLKKIEKLYNLDYESVASMSETTPVSDEKIEFFKSKYENVVLYYNNDKAGIEAMNSQSNNLGVPFYCNPSNMPKDITDVAKICGFQEAVEITKELKKGLELPF